MAYSATTVLPADVCAATKMSCLSSNFSIAWLKKNNKKITNRLWLEGTVPPRSWAAGCSLSRHKHRFKFPIRGRLSSIIFCSQSRLSWIELNT